MFIGLNFGLILLFALMFLVFYFVQEKFWASNKRFVLMLPLSIINVIQGLFYGLLTLGAQAIFRIFFNSFDLQLFVIVTLLLIMFKSVNTTLTSLIPCLIYLIFAYKINTITFLLLGGFFLALFSYPIFSYFIYQPNKVLKPYLIFTLLISFTFLLIGLFTQPKILTITLFNELFLPYLGFAISSIIVSWVIATSINADILNISSLFVFGKYYRNAFEKNVISDFIREFKIHQGNYVIFEIILPTILSPAHEKEIIDLVLIELGKKLTFPTILFHVNNNRYGFFMPFEKKLNLEEIIAHNFLKKRPNNDQYKFLERIFYSLNHTFATSFNQDVPVNVKVGIAIYGLQSNDLSELKKFATFALNINNNFINSISLFSPQIFRKKAQDLLELQTLDHALDVSEYEINFKPIISSKTKEEKLLLVEIKNEVNDMERQYLYLKGILPIFDRFMAASALKKIDHTSVSLIIPYSLLSLTGDFIPWEFIRQLYERNFEPKKIVLLFYCDEFSHKTLTNLLFQNLTYLRNYGIQIALINIHSDAKKNLNFFKPEYVFVSASTYLNNPSKYKKTLSSLIVYDLNNFAPLKRNNILVVKGQNLTKY